MNKRIEELADQTIEFMGGAGDLDIFIDKFAELIIKECVTAVLDEDGPKLAGYVHHGREKSVTRIKEHFGIE